MSSSSTQTRSFGHREWAGEEKATIQHLLDDKMAPKDISSRPGPSGGRVSYVEGWKAIELANAIFGFNGWSSTIVDITPDFIDHENGKYRVGVTAIVKVMLKDGTFHEDVGYGMHENKNKGTSIENAKKEAVTDALKRTLRVFGNGLGNSVYDTVHTAHATKVKPKPVPNQPSVAVTFDSLRSPHETGSGSENGHDPQQHLQKVPMATDDQHHTPSTTSTFSNVPSQLQTPTSQNSNASSISPPKPNPFGINTTRQAHTVESIQIQQSPGSNLTNGVHDVHISPNQTSNLPQSKPSSTMPQATAPNQFSTNNASIQTSESMFQMADEDFDYGQLSTPSSIPPSTTNQTFTTPMHTMQQHQQHQQQHQQQNQFNPQHLQQPSIGVPDPQQQQFHQYPTTVVQQKTAFTHIESYDFDDFI